MYEENPLSPTGKISDDGVGAEGALTNLFASTSTNSMGRYHLVMRKSTPPMVRVHLIFLCGEDVVGHKELDSWHDYWEVNEQVNCRGDAEYETPGFPQNYVDRASFLGCFNDPAADTPTGLSKNEQPTVNNIAREENYDHRFNRNNIEFTHPFSWIIPNVGFQSPGGLWEPDCLLREDKYICNAGASENIIPCNWDNAQTQISGGVSPIYYGNGTLDGTLCNDGTTAMQDSDHPDYVTRPFFLFIPKVGETEEGYRRIDLRVNLENYIEDPLTPLQWMCKFWGCTAGAPNAGPLVFLRKFMQDVPTSPSFGLPNCEELNKRNNAYKLDENANRNKQLNGGPFSGMSAPSDEVKDTYYSVQRDLSEFVCETDSGQLVRFCDIQPTWSPVGLCDVDSGSCSDPDLSTRLDASLTNALNANDDEWVERIQNSQALCGGDFVLDSSYFASEMVFKNQESYTGMASRTINDSQGNTEVKKPVPHEVFNQESISTHESGSRAVKGSGGPFKANSALGPESVINIEMQIPDAESLTDPFTIPFADVQEDYLNEVEWNMSDLGTNQIPACTIGNPFSYELATVAQESDPNFHPDNIFRGNDDNIAHRAAGTASYYPSQDAIDRDTARMNNAGLNWWGQPNKEIGLQNVVLDVALNHIYGRDIWDSILSLSGGDSHLHQLQFDLTAAITTAIGTLPIEAPYKTYGDRDPSQQPPSPTSYYEIVYPVNEPNFEALFNLPDITTGSQLMSGDWGPGHGCYQFSPVPEGQICGTYRENPHGISRTCRVDDCHAYWQVETKECTCISPSGPCTVGPADWNLENGECALAHRLVCAYEQETTPRRASDQVPWEIIVGEPQYNDDYDPPPVDDTDCVPSLFDWTGWTWSDGPKDTDLDGGVDQVKERCDVSVAGPLQGGVECNATLSIGDVALKYSQQVPYAQSSPLYKPQVELDDMFISGVKLALSFRAPYHPAVKGSKIATLDARTTNSPMETENMYTYGAELDTGGWSDYANLGLISTPPVFTGDPGDGLESLYYHCETPGFVPTGSTVDGAEQAAVVDMLLDYDPDLGTDGIDTSIPPDGKIDVYQMGWRCTIDNEPTPVEADLSDVSNNCTISSDLLSACGAAYGAVPDQLSPTFRTVINNAATRFNIPAAALIAILVNEGGFLPQYHSLWADDVVVRGWSLPYYGRMDVGGPITCVDMVWSAQGPYQFLQITFDSFLADELCTALNEISPGRCRSASRCNFLDASYAVAMHMRVGGTCDSFNIGAALQSYTGRSATPGGIALLTQIYNTCRGTP